MQRAIVVFSIAALVITFLSIGPVYTASAEIDDKEGIGCKLEVEVGGQKYNVADLESKDKSDAITIRENQSIGYVATADVPIDRSTVALDVAGVKVPLKRLSPSPGVIEWVGVSTPEDFSNVGKGLHRVVWTVESGEQSCAASMLFKREGGFFSDPVTVAATFTAFLGGLSVAILIGNSAIARLTVVLQMTMGGKKKRRDEQNWLCWLLTPHFGVSVNLTIFTTLAGFLLGGGLVVLAQQTALSLISLELVAKVMLPSMLIPPALQGLAIFDQLIYERD